MRFNPLQRLDPMIVLLPAAAVVGLLGAGVVHGFRLALAALLQGYSSQDHLVAAAAGQTEGAVAPSAPGSGSDGRGR